MSFTYVRFEIDGAAITADLSAQGNGILGNEYTDVYSARSLHGTHIQSNVIGPPSFGGFNVPSFEIIKRVDKLTPLLAAALSRRDVLEVTIKQFRPTPAGAVENFLTMVLSDARVFAQEVGLGSARDSGVDPVLAVLGWDRLQFLWQTMLITEETTGTETTLTWNLEDG